MYDISEAISLLRQREKVSSMLDPLDKTSDFLHIWW